MAAGRVLSSSTGPDMHGHPHEVRPSRARGSPAYNEGLPAVTGSPEVLFARRTHAMGSGIYTPAAVHRNAGAETPEHEHVPAIGSGIYTGPPAPYVHFRVALEPSRAGASPPCARTGYLRDTPFLWRVSRPRVPYCQSQWMRLPPRADRAKGPPWRRPRRPQRIRAAVVDGPRPGGFNGRAVSRCESASPTASSSSSPRTAPSSSQSRDWRTTG
jgi:hypothetical protein